MTEPNKIFVRPLAFEGMLRVILWKGDELDSRKAKGKKY